MHLRSFVRGPALVMASNPRRCSPRSAFEALKRFGEIHASQPSLLKAVYVITINVDPRVREQIGALNVLPLCLPRQSFLTISDILNFSSTTQR
jgi:hypothetical protein